jgi:PAS domain S-box-containing protein
MVRFRRLFKSSFHRAVRARGRLVLLLLTAAAGLSGAEAAPNPAASAPVDHQSLPNPAPTLPGAAPSGADGTVAIIRLPESPMLLGGLTAALLVSLLTLGFLLFRYLRLKRRLSESCGRVEGAESRLRTFSAAVEQSPTSIVITDANARIEYVNPRFTRVTGYPASEVIGLNPSFLNSGQTPRDVIQDMWLTLKQGRSWSGEFVNRRKDGQIYWEEAHISPVMGPDGRPRHYVAVKLDISGRRRGELQGQARTHVLELLAGEGSIADILMAIARDVETGNPEIRCGVMLLDEEGKRLFNAAAPSLPDAYLAGIDGLTIGPETGSCGAAAWHKRRVVVDNIQTHPNWLDYRELAAQARLGACWSEPILSATGAVLGTLDVYHAHPQSPTAVDLQLMEQAARLAAIAIDRSRAQEALRQSEERHRLLAENASDVIWTMDMQGRFTFVSPSAQKLFGYTAEEAMKIGFHQVCAPGSLALANAEFERIRSSVAAGSDAEPFLGELEGLRKDGTTIWTDVSTSLLKDAAGHVTGILGVTRDISKRKQAELALQQLNAGLEERVAERTAELARRSHELEVSEERFRLAMDASTDGLWDAHYLTGECYYSPGYWRMLGYEPGEMPQRQDAWLGLMHPDDRAEFEKVREEKLAAGQFEMEFRLKAKDGSYRWVLSRGRVLLRDGQGRVQRALGTHIDITDRRRAEQAIRDLNASLEQKVAERTAQLVAASAAKSQFLAHMSHELRTPMNAILGLTQILSRDQLAPDQREMVNTISDAGASLLAIINDILDFSKVEAGQMKVEMRPFELEMILKRIASLIEVSAKNRGIGFTVTGSQSAGGPIIGDALRLEQVLSNLCSNAVKFTDTGAVTVNVKPLATEPDSVRLRFEVRDTGIGISPESLSRLFKPFSQADESITRRYGGTGLGLAISRKLVELMGGTIGAESIPGEGSTFWFELPFMRDMPAAVAEPVAATELESPPPVAPAPAPPAPAVASVKRLDGMRLLVVDDNQLNRMLAERALKLEGAQVTLANDGQQALDRLRAGPGDFDAVLMDIQMPVMDGLTATRTLREDEVLRNMPVIALTAGVLPEEREAALAAGVNDFLTKPLNLENLVGVLKSVSGGAD